MEWHLIQLCTVSLYSLNLKEFAEASIHKEKSKGSCVPGLNCYSCPGAVGSCPLGTLQNALSAMDRKLPFYTLGVPLPSGVIMGRTTCGFLCPPSLTQELLYRIPVPRIKRNRVTQELSKVKYVILTVFVIMLPAVFKVASSLPVLAFRKYIRPAGILEERIPLVLLDDSLGDLTGALLHWRVLVLIVILVSACFLYRSFYRVLRPPEATYSLFAPAALLGVGIDKDTCIDCGYCVRTCKIDVGQVGDRERIQCGECMKECNVNATHWKKPWDVKSKK